MDFANHAAARRAATCAAAGALVALGAFNLLYRDTLLSWQPAPAHASWKPVLALVSGGILIASGVLIATGRWRRTGATLAAVWIGLWAVALHLPQFVASGGSIAALNGVAEASAMAFGLETLFWRSRWPAVGFGACCVVFGIAHFVYADFTAAMVPAWMPQRLFVAYATGAVHALMGLALLFGWRRYAAAAIECAMMASFVLLLHLPDLIGAPANRGKLTIFAIALLLTAAAGLVATSDEPPAQ